ncbi:MAG TPA: hypothetical protein VH797_01935 [Nitrososphaeraceae archaeon]|jgi:hypothetical protein
MENIVINFAGDVLLAQAVKNYLTSQDVVSTIFTEHETDELSVSLEENEKNGVKIIKEILRNYLDSHNLTRYQIIQLENILTVGIPKKIEEISNLLMCEICGWRLNTEEELLVHRRIHWI